MHVSGGSGLRRKKGGEEFWEKSARYTMWERVEMRYVDNLLLQAKIAQIFFFLKTRLSLMQVTRQLARLIPSLALLVPSLALLFFFISLSRVFFVFLDTRTESY